MAEKLYTILELSTNGWHPIEAEDVKLTKEKCDFLLSIPMAGELSSLNVSVAAGVTLFEAVRQRSIEPH